MINGFHDRFLISTSAQIFWDVWIVGFYGMEGGLPVRQLMMKANDFP
jgi:hypothetical protein